MKLVICFLFIFFSCDLLADIKESVKLDVPIVRQGKMLCGPATIEMLFKYWGVSKYDQIDIAKSILKQFPNSKRYKESGIFDSNPINWDLYPGTGTINIREFLKRFGKMHNFMVEHEPKEDTEKMATRRSMFNKVKLYLSSGVPVIVHQYWRLPKSRGHYRIVTGYDESKRVVYLNDAHGGNRVVQTYDEFLISWNFDQRWMHYNGIAFNIDKKKLHIAL